MTRTNFSLEVFGDRLPIRRIGDDGESNRRRIEMMKTALRQAMEEELSPKQQRTVKCFYFDKMTVTEIANEYGVNKSTVSRQLKRSVEKLKNAMKYICLLS